MVQDGDRKGWREEGREGETTWGESSEERNGRRKTGERGVNQERHRDKDSRSQVTPTVSMAEK